jgi:hypothetical protein
MWSFVHDHIHPQCANIQLSGSSDELCNYRLGTGLKAGIPVFVSSRHIENAKSTDDLLEASFFPIKNQRRLVCFFVEQEKVNSYIVENIGYTNECPDLQYIEALRHDAERRIPEWLQESRSTAEMDLLTQVPSDLEQEADDDLWLRRCPRPTTEETHRDEEVLQSLNKQPRKRTASYASLRQDHDDSSTHQSEELPDLHEHLNDQPSSRASSSQRLVLRVSQSQPVLRPSSKKDKPKNKELGNKKKASSGGTTTVMTRSKSGNGRRRHERP